MPPKKATASADGSEGPMLLAENDNQFICAMLNSLNSRPDVDWEKLAGSLGLAQKSAKERFRIISKRHNWFGDSSGDSPAKGKGALAAKNTSKVTKKAAPKKKGVARKKTKKEESDEDEDISGKLESDSDGKTISKDEDLSSDSN